MRGIGCLERDGGAGAGGEAEQGSGGEERRWMAAWRLLGAAWGTPGGSVVCCTVTGTRTGAADSDEFVPWQRR
jgi:hypothetical protein